MRPVGDDFCFAASLNNGVLDYIIYWFQNVQFDAFVMASNLVYVAIPIQILPPDLASFISLISVTVTFALSVTFLLSRNNESRSKVQFTILTMLITAAIGAYFFIQSTVLNILSQTNAGLVFLGEGIFPRLIQHANDVANSWAFWGVVNSSYLIPFMLSFAYLVLSKNSNKRIKPWVLIICFIIGTSGYVIAATTVFVILLTQWHLLISDLKLGSYLHRLKALKVPKAKVLQIFAIICGSFFSFISPGAFGRRDSLQSLPPDSRIQLNSLHIDVLRIMGEVFLNIGNIAVISLGCAIGLVLSHNQINLFENAQRIRNHAFIYFIACFVMTTLSEMFSYRAYWHYFTLKFTLFIYFLCVGILLTQNKFKNKKVLVLNVSLSALIVAVSVLGITKEADNRYVKWTSGENYGALPSVGQKGDWVNSCYTKLRESNPQKFYLELKR